MTVRKGHAIILKFMLAATLSITLGACSAGSQLRSAPSSNANQQTAAPSDFTIYAAGDIADCKRFSPADTGAAMTAELIAAALGKNPAAAVLTLGDATYPIGLLAEFEHCYEPTWGRFKSRTYPAPGNHEYYTPAAIGYYRYFGSAAGPAQRGYYSVDLGAWHVISLNSNLKPDDHAAQLAWLKDDLAKRKPGCTLAYWHHPVYSSGGHGSNAIMRDVWKILYAARADVVLSGHDHDYERFAPIGDNDQLDPERGIRQFVVGTGGAKLTWFVFRKMHSEARDNSTHGVLKMVLKESGYEWEFLPVAGGHFTDRGNAQCHVASR